LVFLIIFEIINFIGTVAIEPEWEMWSQFIIQDKEGKETNKHE